VISLVLALKPDYNASVTKKLAFSPSDIIKLYKYQAAKYATFADTSFSWQYFEKPLLDQVLSSLRLKNVKILDAGCGNGRTIKYLLDKKIPEANILGVDISSEMLSIAEKHLPGIKFINSELAKFSSAQKFDLIICTHVLHYLDQKGFQKTLINFYKLLKPGGTLFFVVTHPVRTSYYNLADYFKRDWIIDHTPWGTASPLFLRPISDMVNETIKASFKIKLLEEPQLPVESKDLDPVNYLKYSNCPSRIAIVAIK
jgi:tellurite methyltransferase